MMLSGHSVSNPNAINYFSIKSSEKSGWMHLEDFYNNRYTKKSVRKLQVQVGHHLVEILQF